MKTEAHAAETNVLPLITVENLVKRYARRTLTVAHEAHLALDSVSFKILPGTTLAVAGESGSGKSTLALCIACLESPTAGNIWFKQSNLVSLGERALRQIRPQIQLIFQDPASSLNPKWNVSKILLEPMLLQGKFTQREMLQRAASLLEQVGLSTGMMKRTPAELSGGQRQRLAIARALSLDPQLLILDEALSALDCSVQAQIANLLLELQSSLGMTYLFITHDLSMAAHLADEVLVMSRGRIVEQGPPEKVWLHPEHESTRQLLAAIPRMASGQLPAREL
jgi:ABC-type glutathione transport system ATPase component